MAAHDTNIDLNEYMRQTEPQKNDKVKAWQVAIGLQAVDGLTTSDYLLSTAKRHIDGDLSIAEVQNLIGQYYTTQEGRALNEAKRTEEADKVAANIAEILGQNTFTFSPAGFAAIHRRLFTGILHHAGQYRTYNITKQEWVLRGDSVIYTDYSMIADTLAFDFEQENPSAYTQMDMPTLIHHICKFIAGIWQIHPFEEGNTRTTAIFTIKYLRSLGLNVDNSAFSEHSWYFRNALVRANYHNYQKGIADTNEFLELFFRNLLLGEHNSLKNRYMLVGATWQHQQKVPAKVPRKSTEKSTEKILALMKRKPSITIKELCAALPMSDKGVRKNINKLKEQGRLRRIGPDKGGSWQVTG